jgi:molybdate transport system ATP-binding protein
LLHLLAGLERPDHGRIILDGQTLCDTDRRVFVPPHKRRVGLVFQDARLFPHLSVRGNLKFARRLAPSRSRDLSLDTVAEILELGHLLDRRAPGLSGGERQRVALARTLLSAPRILLLDEPASALDAGREAQLLPFLRRIGQELDLPMVLVSHRLSQIRYLTDTLLLVEAGRLQATGEFSTLIDRPDVVRLLQGHELLNILRLRVVEHQPGEGLTAFKFAHRRGKTRSYGRAPSLKGPPYDCSAGEEMVATVRPEDIIVSLAPAEFVSARNQLAGQIKKIIRTDSRTLCCVDVGVDLLADVTHVSATELELHPGKPIWCLFKTHAMRYPWGSHCAETAGDRSNGTYRTYSERQGRPERSDHCSWAQS